jgi:hypothetical protein
MKLLNGSMRQKKEDDLVPHNNGNNGRVTFKDIKALAAKIDSELLATDVRFQRAVQVIHVEGTQLFYKWAFVEKHKGWFVVFTEHHSFHCFPEEDVQVFQYGEQVDIKRIGGDKLVDDIRAKILEFASDEVLTQLWSALEVHHSVNSFDSYEDFADCIKDESEWFFVDTFDAPVEALYNEKLMKYNGVNAVLYTYCNFDEAVDNVLELSVWTNEDETEILGAEFVLSFDR